MRYGGSQPIDSHLCGEARYAVGTRRASAQLVNPWSTM